MGRVRGDGEGSKHAGAVFVDAEEGWGEALRLGVLAGDGLREGRGF